MRGQRSSLLGLTPALLLLASTVTATPIVAADWVTTSTGTLNGISFAAAGLVGGGGLPASIVNRNYSGSDFSAAPVGIAKGVAYGADNDWSVTFNSPITDLLLIVDVWRGDFQLNLPDPTSTYAFSRPFSIASGLSGASVLGNTLSLPDLGGFYNGVLIFPGTFSVLSVDATALNSGQQILTFAVADVPEPSSIVLVFGGLAAVALRVRGRRGNRAAAL